MSNSHGRRKSGEDPNQSRRKRGWKRRGADIDSSQEIQQDVGVASEAIPSRHNDISWHVKDVRWLQSVSNPVAFGLPLGSRIDWGETGGTLANNTSIPGVMTFICTPTYGIANDENSELNRAMVDVFNKVRSKISGSRSYERTDLMKYFLAIDSLHMFYSFISRAYKMLNLTSHINYYVSKALVESMGLSYENLIRNRADLYSLIREFRVNMARYATPVAMDIYKRHKWLFDHIWKDTDSLSAQMYMFLPRTFYKWHDVYEQTERPGISPILIPWIDIESHGLGTVDDLWDLSNQLLRPLTHNGDVSQMAADVASVYGGDIWIPEDFPIDATYVPEFDKEALMQIANLTMIGDFELDDKRPVIFEPLDIPAKHGYLMSDFRFKHPYFRGRSKKGVVPGTAAFTVNKMVNYDETITTPEGIMYATRLMNIPTGVNNQGYWEWSTLSTEVVNYGRIHFFSIADCATTARGSDIAEILPLNPYDLRHYETDRIFTSMVRLSCVGAEPISTTHLDNFTVGTVLQHWNLDEHDYNIIYNTGFMMSQSCLDNPYLNIDEVRIERSINEIRTMMSTFAMHPPVAYTSAQAVVDILDTNDALGFITQSFIGFDQDLDVCGTITPRDLRRLNKVDVSSEFDVQT